MEESAAQFGVFLLQRLRDQGRHQLKDPHPVPFARPRIPSRIPPVGTAPELSTDHHAIVDKGMIDREAVKILPEFAADIFLELRIVSGNFISPEKPCAEQIPHRPRTGIVRIHFVQCIRRFLAEFRPVAGVFQRGQAVGQFISPEGKEDAEKGGEDGGDAGNEITHDRDLLACNN